MAEGVKTELKEDKIAVIGSGQIGTSWALLFASAGYKVRLYDVTPGHVTRAFKVIQAQLDNLSRDGLLRGTLTVEERIRRITSSDSLTDCVKDACWVQECIPEEVDLKRKLFAEVDGACAKDAIIASSTSTFLPSDLSRDLKCKEYFLVVHPTNPPSYSRAVELVPAPWTKTEVMTTAQSMMRGLGQCPITLKKEIPGFVLNRLHFALLAESYRQVKDGILSVDGVNKMLSAGLGRRYAFLGPFQTAHLNAEGFESYLERYGDQIYRVQKSFGPPVEMGGELAKEIEKELVKEVPLDQLDQARRRREKRMGALTKLKREIDKEEST